MKNILLRARKDPFRVVSPAQALEQNLIGSNSGNVLFANAAYKLLATRDVQIDVDGFRTDAAAAEHINERYDAYVIPLANAFRASFEPHLIRLTRLIKRLRIPVVVLGVGAQSKLGIDSRSRSPLDRSVQDFVGAVLDRGAAVGVRGEFTQSYLEALGFNDVEVIGCPSMFVNGADLRVEKKVSWLDRDARISINAGADIELMGDMIMSHYAGYRNLCYVAQDLETLGLMVWGESPLAARKQDKFPRHLQHPLFRENKVRFFIEPGPWLSFMSSYDFAFGTRIHGNIAALTAGTPAYVLFHDSRTLELARYFDIPRQSLHELAADTDAADLYQAADYTALNRGHAARWARFTDFLARHSLRHVYLEGEDSTAFDRRMALTPLAGGVDASSRQSAGPPALKARLRHQLWHLSQGARVGRLRATLERWKSARERVPVRER